ncbi:Sec-dependent nitrous-oxide reductase [Oceanobacillus halotolerans]|uniref:Sec-dependent nitrous-oxide reductase n=1 Tax=Oceanobacillus halotolerans TaxID=2663380 RepID=UPI0013D99D63|nr:Sec-dependent nitrous-oxide reductase [Oceanobacillus halotolerans]
MNTKRIMSGIIGVLAGLLVAMIVFTDFNQTETVSSADNKTNAEKVYVAPGEQDDYYMMASGGHSGQLFVYGLPSMRLIRQVPVFSPDPATGYGFDKKSKEMLNGYKWGDFHHPAISETEGEYDGRALFASDVGNNRAAYVDLETFHTTDILEIPNISGPHCAAFVTPNSEYFFLPTRFSVPLGDEYVGLDDFSEEYKGVMSAVKPDFENNSLEIAYQVMLPPWSYDLSDAGKGQSNGWGFLSTYNTEEATTTLEINASQNDRDYIVMFNWEQISKEVEEGNYEEVNGVKMFDPLEHPGSVYLVPAPKSPHGVDVTPDGDHFIASGKLSPTTTMFSVEKALEAIENEDFQGEAQGLPILTYESVVDKEVEVGLGPLHTQFDDKGNAYTTLFIDSQVVKWDLESGKVIDKEEVSYSPGHLTAVEGDTAAPGGDWLVSLNKIAKDHYLSVGPSHPESMDLIDISGETIEVVGSAPSQPEPHYAQIINADKINTTEVYDKDEDRENAVWDQADTRIERDGDEVHVYGIAMRSRFIFDADSDRPDTVTVKEGDTVHFHITNTDRDEDITHGMGINGYNENFEIQPGETKTLTIEADKSGSYPIYCTNFCSALHQEMTGYLLVEPK